MLVQRQPLPVLEEMPENVLRKIVTHSGLVGRLSLLRVNHKLRDIAMKTPLHLKSVKVLTGIGFAWIIMAEIHENVEYEISYNDLLWEGCKSSFHLRSEDDQRRKYYIHSDASAVKGMRDLANIIGNENTTTGQFSMNCVCLNPNHRKELFYNLANELEQLNRQIKIGKFACLIYSEHTLKLLSFMKPGYLKYIWFIHNSTCPYDANFDAITSMEQFRQADHFLSERTVITRPMEEWWHFKTIEVNNPTFDINELPRLLQHFLSSSTFMRCELTHGSNRDEVIRILNLVNRKAEHRMPDGGTLAITLNYSTIKFERLGAPPPFVFEIF